MPDYSKYSDSELTVLLNEASPVCDRAFYVIYQKYTPKVFAYCMYRTGTKEEAEEVLQDTWLKFFNSMRSGKRTDNILPFVYSIARNACIDKFRRKSAEKNPSLEYFDFDSLEEIADPFHFQQQFEKEELTSLLKIAVNYLDDIYKETIILYWFGGLEMDEIAKVCGESVKCVRTRYARAVKQLITILKPYILELTD